MTASYPANTSTMPGGRRQKKIGFCPAEWTETEIEF